MDLLQRTSRRYRRWGMGLLGLSLALLSVWRIQAAAGGLEVTPLPSTTPPLTIVAPAGAAEEPRPLVLVGHGFAGSGLLMRGYALALAHAGYSVVLWDFDGHGANPRPLPLESQSDALLPNAEAALAEAEARGLVAPGRVAILGHSMGSGVALAYGQKYPATAATVAISPVGQRVTPTLPRNLLLMAGSLEAPFVRNAEQRLAEAGGAGGDPAAGTARALRVISGVEHVSILFAPASHAAARDWLDATFGPQPGAADYTDRRMAWCGLGLLGVLLIGAALAPSVADPAPADPPRRPLGRRLGAAAGGVLGATLGLWAAGVAGLGLRDLLGLLVGGYLMIWFGLAGLLNLLLLRSRPALPSRRAVLAGLLAFAALWVGVGSFGQLAWLPWLLIRQRLLLWPLGGLLLLPWFLALGEAGRDANLAGRIGWWLAHSAVLAAGLALAMALNPELGFLGIILPLLPVVLALHALASAPHRGRWPFALSGALFLSWLFLAVFPLQ